MNRRQLKRTWKRTWPLLLLTLGLFCTSCNAKPDPSAGESKAAAPEKNSALTETAGALPSAGNEPAKPLSPRIEAVCGSYFKAGDFTYRLELTPGSPDRPDTLRFIFQTRDLGADYKDWSNVMVTLQELTVSYEDAGESIRLEDQYPLSFNLDGSITLEDGTKAAGTYYSFEEHLIMPDAFLRPLNDTDLIGLPPEDMKLIRNECYAVYGRPFQSADLQSYFGNQPWYRAAGQPEDFNDNILGGMVKRNVDFMKNAEENYDSNSAKALENSYENLPKAPYLSLLPNKGEISVTIGSSPDMAQDCGIYYKAQGVIGLPFTFTSRQKEELDTGKALEVDASSLMDGFGQWADSSCAWLKKAENPQHGEYVLLHTPDENEENGFSIDAFYSPDTGVYTLWHNSGDTIFQKVYEGDIYVLKGACEEYYRYFDLPRSSRIEGAGNFRILDFNETDGVPYVGNQIVVDDKGYIKALYYYGD